MRLFFTIFFIIVYVNPVCSGIFDDIGVGARAVAMGEAFTGAADNASAVYWNPAGLTRIKKRKIEGMHTDLYSLNLVDYSTISYAHPGIAGGVVGFMYQGLSSTDDVDFLEFNESTYTLSYAYQLFKNFSVGINGKYFYADLGFEGSGVGFDIAGLLKINERVRVGLMIKNINTPAIHFSNIKTSDVKNTDTLERDVRAGIAFSPVHNLLLTTDFTRLDSTLFEPRVGMEYYLFNRRFAVRAGAIDKRRNKFIFTFGAGVRVENFSLDYAYKKHFDLKETHYVSLLYDF